ncbi:histone-lysine N-methyltransferase EHMT2-like [Liolophura sinensis]|uniref:histone-lysine N-methyltransferase EHMT2-like n=1 Tax=Liolophura sinensis TaxID=3198878 RepID=UPI0031587732
MLDCKLNIDTPVEQNSKEVSAETKPAEENIVKESDSISVKDTCEQGNEPTASSESGKLENGIHKPEESLTENSSNVEDKHSSSDETSKCVSDTAGSNNTESSNQSCENEPSSDSSVCLKAPTEERKTVDENVPIKSVNTDLKVSSCIPDKTGESAPKDKNENQTEVDEKALMISESVAISPQQSYHGDNLPTNRTKCKQKARKSSKPFRQVLSVSSVKTVNLAPIANVRVKLPDIESALSLPGKPLENAKLVHAKKAAVHEIPSSEPVLISSSLPPAEEKAHSEKLLPVTTHAAMNSRVRHQRKRIRRWGKGDLPLRKTKKKRLVRANNTVAATATAVGNSVAPLEHVVENKCGSETENDQIRSNQLEPLSEKQALVMRQKPTPTILQLLTKSAPYRPRLNSCKTLSMLRAKRLRPSGSERSGKTVAELLMESNSRKIQVTKDHQTVRNGPGSLQARLGQAGSLNSEGVLITSPGLGLGRRVSLRKRKPTEEEDGCFSPVRDSTIMATPGSGSKKRKMCTPERVVSGGEKWQKGDDYEIPEADQGTGDSPDLPPPNISTITTVTRQDGDGSGPSVNVEISLDPPVITMSGVTAMNASYLTHSQPEKKHFPKGEQTYAPSPSSKNSTLRSVLLDQMSYPHPLLGRKPAISLLSGKASHTPNGAIYPVTPTISDEGPEEGNQPRPASAPGVGSSSPPQRDIIPLCCCKINGACVSKLTKPVIYCQALDSVDGKVMGCCNKVSSPQLVRPAVKIPFMAVCEVHRKRLKLHQCCPGCGHFCTQGPFYQCRKEGGSSIHHFHKSCQVFKNGKYFCPHCGEESLQFEVNLRLNEPRHMTKFGKSEHDVKQTISRAKMGIHANTYKTRESDLPDSVSTASYTLEGSNKTFSTAGLPFGPDRYSLERILYLLPQERPKKYRVLPKCIYGPAKDGDLDKVVYMLVEGSDPNEKFPDFDGHCAVHAAGIGGSLPVLHVLIQAGGEVNCIDGLLKTPLMYASENSHLPLIKYLVKAGASVHSRGEDGMTCLHLAAKAGHIDVMRYLLHFSDIDINVQDDGGWTPIIWAAEHRHVASVKFLLSQGADPNLKDQEENTGLHWAAFSGSVDIAEIFLNAGCDIESPNEHGDRPLHIAARQDHYECVVLILARGGDVEARNNENEPPIGCCLDQNSQVWMALRVNRQLKGFAAKRLARTERLIHRDITLGKENNPIPGVNAVDEEENPTDYLYITENCETTPLNINRTITSLQSCNCKDSCSSNMCNCSRNSVKCWFDKDGRLLPEFNTLEPPLIFECNRACRCWTTCNNRVVQNGITVRLQLFRTCNRGWGVKTLLDIPQGSFICEYIGELISDSEADRREDDSYLFDLDNKDGETYCIDARKYGNISRFINHLCEPNIIPVKVFVEHQDLRFPRICFFSSRPIKAQEELGFDYGEKFWMIKWKQFTCACGSPKCKYSSETIQKTLEEYRLRHEDDETPQPV